MPDSTIYDVCLILEGTYPYVSGGVSTWVHNLVRALPDIQFCAVSIFPSEKETRDIKYEMPDNFRLEKIVYIHDYQMPQRKSDRLLYQRQPQPSHHNYRSQGLPHLNNNYVLAEFLVSHSQVRN